MFSSRMKYDLGAKKELIEAQRELGISNSPVEEKNIKSFSIANWLSVQIDDFQLQRMTRRRAKAIAKVVEITLLKNTKLDRGDDND